MSNYQPPTSSKWHIGQRVERIKPNAVGTVVEIDGRMKVKWDTGAVSYYSLHQSLNIKPARDMEIDDSHWKILAHRYREEAAQQPPGPKREEYLKKAENLERSISSRSQAK